MAAHANLNQRGEVVQNQVSVSCRGERGALNFRLNRSTQVAVFSDKSALFRAELPMGRPIAYASSQNSLRITYDWYFTAEYTLTFAKPVNALRAGESVAMSLTGDDGDGFIFNDVPFRCTIR